MQMIYEYIFVIKYVFFCLIVSCILTLLSVLLVDQEPEVEKLSSYECGFNPFGDARNKFDVKFYLVGILFMVFDLELAFLFPWVIAWDSLSVVGRVVMYIFVLILTFAESLGIRRSLQVHGFTILQV